MDDMLTRCAKAVWDLREKRYPARIRQSWAEGSDLARTLMLEEVECVLVLAMSASPAMWDTTKLMSHALPQRKES